MKKILITGGTGFVGSNLARAFLAAGDEVHLIIRPESNLWRIASIQNQLKLHAVDLTNAKEVNAYIPTVKPDVIVHCATYGAYPGRQTDSQPMIATNVLGTVNLLDACVEAGFQCFINTGSSSEYGAKDHPISERDLPEPNSLYGVTKAAGTAYCRLTADKTGLPIITLRLFSPYGYFEDPQRLMPNLVRAGLNNTQFAASSASAVRDFSFIEDVITAYQATIANADRAKGLIFNVASGKQHSISEVVSIIEKILDKKINAVYGAMPARQAEPKMWVADISAAQAVLGWSPVYSLEDGLSKYMKWVNNQ